jgi:hypothetical protein
MGMNNPIAIASSGDLFGFSGQCLQDRVKRYASGVLSPAIWAGYQRAGRAVCIAASEAGESAIGRALQYAEDGGDLFIDSGAFIFKDNPGATPWAVIIEKYRRIASNATRPVTFVLPDVVGDQNATLEVLRSWGDAVLQAIGPNHIALLPVQRGSRMPSTFIKEAQLILSGPIGGLAIPSHAAAFPPAMLKDLVSVSTSVPRRVHFLGISRRSKALQERLLRLEEVWPGSEVSCDACEHRAQLGRGRKITDARSAALDGLWDEALDNYDDTEQDSESTTAAMKLAYPSMDDDSIGNMMLSQAGGWVDLTIAQGRHAKSEGPKATTESIYQFATGQLDKSSRFL